MRFGYIPFLVLPSTDCCCRQEISGEISGEILIPDSGKSLMRSSLSWCCELLLARCSRWTVLAPAIIRPENNVPCPSLPPFRACGCTCLPLTRVMILRLLIDAGFSAADREASLELIKLDISRTFPNLCIFQQVGGGNLLL